MDATLIPRSCLKLEAGQIDIWLTCLCNSCREDESVYLRLLTADERSKWRRYVVQDARLQYLVSRALVRAALSNYAEVPELIWEFAVNRYGRPDISHPQAHGDIRFNLSNTSGLVACAITKNCEIGVDVENVRRTLDDEALAPAVFAPRELKDFRSCPPRDRRERFFSYWTLKEAYIKARGMGLSIPLDAFWFDLSGPSPTLHVTDRCHDTPARWRFRQFVPTTKHRLAIAATASKGADPSVHLHWTTLTAASAVTKQPRCAWSHSLSQVSHEVVRGK
jgi:4'-phosphopantetheinyl transferase